MKKSFSISYRVPVFVLLVFLSFASRIAAQAPVSQEYYEIKIYHFTQASQEMRIDSFLQQAYLPALHRAGIAKVGVFKPVETDTAFGKRIYVFIPFKTLDQFAKLKDVLNADKQYIAAGKSYLNALYNNKPYARMESILLKSFTNYPVFQAPAYTTPVSERVYELRSYESPTESYGAKKIDMFNRGGEINIFKKLQMNPLFFAEVISGNRMPNLIYMPTFQNKATQDEKWLAFRNDPDWKVLSAVVEYKNVVSKIQSFPLHPTSYSDL